MARAGCRNPMAQRHDEVVITYNLYRERRKTNGGDFLFILETSMVDNT